ncbi:MAG: 30S ribosomal protein S21 [Nanoarchaeota archaeon]
MGLNTLIEVKVRKGQSIDIALRIFKRRTFGAGIIAEVKRHKYYMSPGEEKRKKKKAMAFTRGLHEAYERLEDGHMTETEFEEEYGRKPYAEPKRKQRPKPWSH